MSACSLLASAPVALRSIEVFGEGDGHQGGRAGPEETGLK